MTTGQEPRPAWHTPMGSFNEVRAEDEGMARGARVTREHEGGSLSTCYCFLNNVIYSCAYFQG